MCTCPVCETQFEYKANKKFCSRNCKQRARAKPYLLHPKGTSCSKCGFKAEHRCQLDLDHIDGNKINNSAENIQVLCANCHRLKTYLCGDSYPTVYRDSFVPLNTCYDESKTIAKPNILLSGSQRELDAQSIGVQE